LLSDNKNRAKVPSSRRRATGAATNKHWSDSQKIEAVTTYLTLGNLVLTSNVLKIPEMTLRGWKQTQWWKDIESELRVQENIQLSSRLQRILDKTLEACEDRIQNGDLIYDNKTGQLIRKPVNLRDAHKVAMDMIDKREHLQNKEPTVVAMEQIDDRLKKLADQFAQIARKTAVVEVTDVIEVETAHGSSTPKT
jgi:hypothetical protein